jgi:Holliday junction resolvase RusA-like endonuclease
MRFTIKGRLDGLNEYVEACRRNKYEANEMKRMNQRIVRAGINEFTRFDRPVSVHIAWYEPNARRDVDNIAFAVKFILDEMVRCGILENDGQKHVKKITHEVLVDKKNPRIEVEVEEWSV